MKKVQVLFIVLVGLIGIVLLTSAAVAGPEQCQCCYHTSGGGIACVNCESGGWYDCWASIFTHTCGGSRSC